MLPNRFYSLPALCVLLSACVTINIYFPAAAAEKAADRIIRDILGKEVPEEGKQPAEPDASKEPAPGASLPPHGTALAALWLVDRLIPVAHGAGADLSIDSPQIRKIRASMKQRYPSLKPYFDNGAIGLAADGSVAVRDAGLAPLRERNTLKKRVNAENNDRAALYREIAKANNHPEWEGDVRKTFARQWVQNAPGGWFYQDNKKTWKQK